jgi:hypothetical protein
MSEADYAMQFEVELYDDDTDEYKMTTVDIDTYNYGGSYATNIWSLRDAFEPPAKGFVMFADSGADTNIDYLLQHVGLDPEQVCIVLIGGQETVWRNDQ